MLKKSKRTVVFVSHDMNAVREFCDQALLIEASKVVAVGKASHIASQYSRLFIDDKETGADVDAGSVDQQRWGDGAAKIESVSLSKNILSDTTPSLKFTTTIKAIREAKDLVVGFVVKDGFGVEICGTNTQIKGIRALSLSAGELCALEWECENIFNEGKHTLDVAVHRVDGVTVHDWWEGASAFLVKRTEKTAYRISPPISVSLKSE